MDTYSHVLLDNLCQMYKDNVLTDVTLQSHDVRIDCHRNVLAAASPYFRAMFVNPVKERDENVIQLFDIDPDVLPVLIGYIYTGNIELTNENVQDFLTTGSMLELAPLIDKCSDYMIQQISLENCLDVFKFSAHFACTKLKQSARTFILEHFSEVSKDPKLLELETCDLEDLVSSDEISVEHEEDVFELIQSWTYADISFRQQLFPQLFKHVRLSLINGEYITNRLRNCPLVTGSSMCQRMLKKMESLREGESQSKSYPEINATPRQGMFNRKLLIFSGGGNGEHERSLTAFDPATCKNYIGIKPHPTFDFKYKVDHYQLAATANNLYFLGGIFFDDHHIEDLGPALKEVYKYDMKNVVWERKCDMKRQRCCFSVAVKENIIYAIGGKAVYPRGKPIDTVEFYDADNDAWNTVSPVPITIYNHSSCILNDAIFVFGGKDEDDDFLDTVFRYDIPTDTWTLVSTQMPKPRSQLSALTNRSLIYLVGGVTLHENVLSVAIYDPKLNKWTSGEEFPEERKVTSSCIHDGRIYVCGGVRHLGLSGRRSRKVESRDLFQYDIEQDQWRKIVKLVQYGNIQSVTSTMLNIKYLQESEFISSL